LQIGRPAIATPPLPRGGYTDKVAHVLAKNYAVVAMHWSLSTRVMPDLVRSTHEDLVEIYEAGEIDPLISEVVSFEQLPKAPGLLGGRSTYGKIVLRPEG